MRKVHHLLLAFAGLLLLGLCSSCNDLLRLDRKKDITLAFEQKPDIVVPIAYGSASLFEVLDGYKIGGNYLVVEDNDFYIRYEAKRIFSFGVDALFNNKIAIPKQVFHYPKQGYKETKDIEGNKLYELKSFFPDELYSADLQLPKEVLKTEKLDFDAVLLLSVKDSPINARVILNFLNVQNENGQNIRVALNIQPSTRERVYKIPLYTCSFRGEAEGNVLPLKYRLELQPEITKGTVSLVQGEAIKLESLGSEVKIHSFAGKLAPYKTNLEKIKGRPWFDLYKNKTDFQLHEGKLALSFENENVEAQLAIQPSFAIKHKNQPSSLWLGEREEMLLKGQPKEFIYQGEKVQELFSAFFQNTAHLQGLVEISPDSEQLILAKGSKIHANLLFEQKLDFSLGSLKIDYTSQKIEMQKQANFMELSKAETLSLVIYGQSNIPLQLNLEKIVVLDENKKPTGQEILIKGEVKGSLDNQMVKSHISTSISKAEFERLRSEGDIHLSVRGTLSSLRKERVSLKSDQEIKMNILIGCNHQFK